MKYELLRQDALNKTDYVFKSDSTAKMLADYYDWHGTPNEKMLAHYLLGRAYMDMNEWPAALQSMQDAASKADTTAEDCDYYTLCRVHGQTSDIYRFQVMPRQQLQELALSEKYAWLANDTSTAIGEYAHRADAYGYLKDRDSALFISERAAELYCKYGYRQEAAMMLGNAVYDLVLSRQYGKAGRYINDYKAYSGLFDSKGNIGHGYESFYYALGFYYMGIGKPDSAEYYFRKELHEGRDANNQISANYGLAKLYAKTGKAALAEKHAIRTLDIDDSVDVQQTADRLQNIQSLYDYSRNLHIAEKKTAENKFSLGVICFLSTIIVFLFVLAYLLVKIWKNKAKQIREANQNRINRLACNYQELQILRNKEKEHYDWLIKEKEDLLKQQSASIFDAMSYGSESTEEIKKIKTSEIYQRFLAHLGTDVSDKLSQKDWSDLYDWVNTNFRALYECVFINHSLSETDRKICILTFIHLTPSEIAVLTDHQITNVSTSRRRIVKKLTGKDGKAKDLNKLLTYYATVSNSHDIL